MSRAAFLALKPWMTRSLTLTPELQRFPTMLSPEEQRMLVYLAATLDFAQGTIVDLGPFLGGSTAALGHGLAMNPGARTEIHSFDLFNATHALKQKFLYSRGHPPYEPEDVYPLFQQLTAPYPVVSRKTNILNVTWDRPIALLFVDLCKSWKLNDHVTATFFPHLRPGAIVVQQDYMFSHNPWVCSTMYKLRDHVRYAGHTDYNSVLFEVVATPDAQALQACSRAGTTHDEILASFDWTAGFLKDWLSIEMLGQMRRDYLDFRDAKACEDFVLRPWPVDLPRALPG